jgi:hypothetical protein
MRCEDRGRASTRANACKWQDPKVSMACMYTQSPGKRAVAAAEKRQVDRTSKQVSRSKVSAKVKPPKLCVEMPDRVFLCTSNQAPSTKHNPTLASQGPKGNSEQGKGEARGGRGFCGPLLAPAERALHLLHCPKASGCEQLERTNFIHFLWRRCGDNASKSPPDITATILSLLRTLKNWPDSRFHHIGGGAPVLITRGHRRVSWPRCYFLILATGSSSERQLLAWMRCRWYC